MQKERATQYASRYKEDEIFWRKHFAALSASGLNRSQYCLKEKINYDRFGYYISKWNQNNKTAAHSVNTENNDTQVAHSLLPVRMKSMEPMIPASEEKVLCRLALKNGSILTIHHEQALSLLLSMCL